MTVQELFRDERRWTKGAMARSISGNKCYPEDKLAECFCLVGALRHCYPDLVEYATMRQHVEYTLKSQGFHESIVAWNDRRDRTLKEVQELVKLADV